MVVDGETNFVVLTDEDGKEIELELLSTLEYDDEIYMAFTPTHANEENDEIEIVILQSAEEDGEEILITVDDDSRLEKVYEMFMRRIEEDAASPDNDES